MTRRLDVCLDAARPAIEVELDGDLAGVVALLRPMTPAVERAAKGIADRENGPLSTFAETCWDALVESAFRLSLKALRERQPFLEDHIGKFKAAAAKLKKKLKKKGTAENEATHKAMIEEIIKSEKVLGAVVGAINRADIEGDRDIIQHADLERVLYRLKAGDAEAWAACHEYQRHQERVGLAHVGLCLEGLMVDAGEGKSGARKLETIGGWEDCDFDQPGSVIAHLQGVVDPTLREDLFDQLRSRLYEISVVPDSGKEPSGSSRGTSEDSGEKSSSAPTA